MARSSLFEMPTTGAAPGVAGLTYLAEVVSVQDPDSLGRVQVRLLSYDGVADQDGPLWARVAVPFAGDNRGAFMLPDVGDEVLVTAVNGDPRLFVVVGGLWNGSAKPPETLGGSGDRIDRWTIVGKAGTRIAIVEETQGQETVAISTPNGVKATLTDEAGGKITLEAAGNTITMDTQGITIEGTSKVKVSAAQVEVSAGMVKVDAAMSKFSGIIKCDTLITNSVVSSSYTPGAGNIW